MSQGHRLRHSSRQQLSTKFGREVLSLPARDNRRDEKLEVESGSDMSRNS